MNKARCGKSVYWRKDEFSPWQHEDFPSLSLAKEKNGLNSTTVERPGQLPPTLEKPQP